MSLKVKTFAAVFVLTAMIAGGVYLGYEYHKSNKELQQASELWTEALLSAQQGNYEDAIDAADIVIATFGEYAEEKEVGRHKIRFERLIFAKKLWLEAKKSTEGSKYERAIIETEKLINEYPDYHNIGEAKIQLTEWKNIVSAKKQISGLLAKAKKAIDDGRLEEAGEAIGAVLALDPENKRVKSLKAEIIEQKEGGKIAALEERFDKLKNQGFSFEADGDWENAIRVYITALSIKPEDRQIKKTTALCNHNIYLAGGLSAEQSGDLDAAIKQYTEALSYKNVSSTQEKLEVARAKVEAQQLQLKVEEWMTLARKSEDEKYPARAFEYYLKAANEENTSAMYKVGLAYYNGIGADIDYTRAIDWLRKAAEQGEVLAMFDLATIYYEGRGVDRAYIQAIGWFRKAADAGNSQAMFNLGRMYDNNSGVVEGQRKAFGWYQRSAEAGDSRAMSKVGQAYYNGLGVDQDYTKAFRWLLEAAEAGNSNAMVNLGLMYYEGDGVAKDCNVAVDWYSKAAENDNSTAMYDRGTMYLKGSGVDKDMETAVVWYKKAAKLGDEQAKEALVKLKRIW